MSISFPSSSYKPDVHLYPLYLKWAAEKFSEDRASEGMDFFRRICDRPRDLEYKVYECLWKRRGSPQGVAEYGRNAFHDVNGLSSSALEKAQVIRDFFSEGDEEEIKVHELEVYRWLWIVKGMPGGNLEYGRHAFHNMHGFTSTRAERALAIQRYVKESRLLTWLVGNREVRILKKQDQLEYLVLDNVTGGMRQGIISCDGQPMAVVARLAQRDIVLKEDLSPTFPVPSVCRNVLGGINEIRLQQRENDLVWRLFDKTMGTISWIPAVTDPVYRRENPGAVFYSDNQRVESQINYLEDFTFITASSSEGRLVGVSLGKVTFPSLLANMTPINNRDQLTIDRDRWAVTLIDTNSCNIEDSYDNQLGWAGHAQIIIEKVVKGKHWITKAHLTAKEGVRYSDYELTPKTEAYLRALIRGKSETSIRPKEQVQAMIASIQAEHADPMNHPVLFHFLGSDSLWAEKRVYVQGHGIVASPYEAMVKKHGVANVRLLSPTNCITWARGKMSLAGIELGCSGMGWLMTIPKHFTQTIK